MANFIYISYPATILYDAVATPAVYAKIDGTLYVMAAFVNKNTLQFFYDQADWAFFSSIFGGAWLNWASNGVVGGLRRIEFNAQIDDIFMATGDYDPNTGVESKATTYRLNPTDVAVSLVPRSHTFFTSPFSHSHLLSLHNCKYLTSFTEHRPMANNPQPSSSCWFQHCTHHALQHVHSRHQRRH